MLKPTTAPAATAEGPNRPMRADARRNYERLVAVAAEAFAEHGADASLDDIAKRAGVGSGTLYRHFPTRHALLEAVYREQVETLSGLARELLDVPSPDQALETYLRALVGYCTAKRGLAELMHAPDQTSGLLSRGRAEITESAAELLARAQREGGVRADVDLHDLLKLVSMIGSTVDGAADGDQRADRMLSLVVDGLRHPAPAG